MGSFFSSQDGEMLSAKRISENLDTVVDKQEIMKEKAEELCKLIKEQDSSVKELRSIKETLSERFVTEEQNICLKRDYKRCAENKEHLEEEKKKNIELESEVISLKAKMDTEQKEYTHLKQHAKRLKENGSKLDEEIIRYREDNSKIKQEINIKDKENHRLKQEIDSKDKENHRLKQEINIKDKENHRLKQGIDSKEYEIRQLRERLRQREAVRVLLYCAVQQKLMNEVSTELQTILTTHMESQGYCLEIDICDNPQHRPPGLPLLVLCINASRLGTDVSQALQHVTCEQTVAVVVLHNKKLHALPSQSSERLLVGGNYKQLGKIVDIAYVAGDGMYACDMNNNALTNLCYFIQNFK